MAPIPIDKYGKPIYSKPFAKIVKNSVILEKNGYKESYRKPNLFYKKISEGMLFADMRSSDVIPIWQDTRPLFYWNFDYNTPNWKRRRLIKQELKTLHEKGCPSRLSFYAPFSSEELEGFSTYIDEESGIFEWHDGHCTHCNKDIKSDDPFCSDTCKTEYENSFKQECRICRKLMDWNEEVGHHLSYKDDIKYIFVKMKNIKSINQQINVRKPKRNIN